MGGVKINVPVHLSIEEEFLNTSLSVDDVDAVLPAVTPRLDQSSVVGVHLHTRHRELPHLLAAGQPARMDPIELPAVLVPLDAVNLKNIFSCG